MRIPNERLGALLAEAEWAGEALARAVNVVGAESGVPLHYHRSAIAHWLSGMRPRGPVPEFVAEAFSRRLGRTVTIEQTGLVPMPYRTNGGWWQDDPAGRLAELSTQDKRAYVLAAELMLPLFSTADATFGGGHVRAALAAYLGHTVGPWLRCDATASVRRDLLVVAARLSYLSGFAHFDEQLHGLAQRYYLTSLMLATEAGDGAGRALALRGLSVQARALGHRRQAVQLAEAAVAAAGPAAGAQTRAFLTGQLAVAHAAAGDRRAALAQLTLAERELDRAEVEPRPVGDCHSASLAHQHAAVLAGLGDRAGALATLRLSVLGRPVAERRSRTVLLARLAELQFAEGQLEPACRTWTRFLTGYAQVRSGRAERALAELRALILPHRRNPVARQLIELAAGAHCRKRACPMPNRP